MCVICTWSLAEEIRHFPFEMLLKRSGWLVTVMASKAERIKKKGWIHDGMGMLVAGAGDRSMMKLGVSHFQRDG